MINTITKPSPQAVVTLALIMKITNKCVHNADFS